MRRNLSFICGLATFIIWSSLSVLASGKAEADQRPNIIFLLADDMGYGDLGCYGHPVIKSPNIDKLAAGGLRLTDCHSAAPNCSPSRTGILTGRTPYRVGMYNYANFKALHISREERTVAEVLKDAGYQTMFAGKWHCSAEAFPGPEQPDPGDHGFDHWMAAKKNFPRNYSGFYRNRKPVGKTEAWMSEIVVDEAMSWLDQRDPGKPFVTMLWFSEPHTPVQAAEEFKAPYRSMDLEAPEVKKIKYGGPEVKRNRLGGLESQIEYYGCISMLDHHIGRLIDYLDEKGLRENTLIVFTSDNGPEYRFDHGYGTPGNLRGAKNHLHEGGIRVPGIINWPGKISPKGNASFPVCGTDFLPTFAALAGVAVGADKPVDGMNLWPVLQNPNAPKRDKPIMWWAFRARADRRVVMRVGDYKILAEVSEQGDLSNMDYIKTCELIDFDMYNLREDVTESRDLKAVEPERFAQLRKQMIKMHAEIQAEGPVIDMTTPASREKKKKSASNKNKARKK